MTKHRAGTEALPGILAFFRTHDKGPGDRHHKKAAQVFARYPLINFNELAGVAPPAHPALTESLCT